MLQFKSMDTTITLVSSGHAIIATRFINNKVCRVVTRLDGTVLDYSIKANRLISLPSELFEEFDRIQDDLEVEGEY